MSVIEIVMVVALLVMGVFLIVTMLLQKNEKGLSGTIAGGAETYYGAQGQKQRRSRILNIVTIVVSVVFVLVVFAAFAFQPDYNIFDTVDAWQDNSKFYQDWIK